MKNDETYNVSGLQSHGRFFSPYTPMVFAQFYFQDALLRFDLKRFRGAIYKSIGQYLELVIELNPIIVTLHCSFQRRKWLLHKLLCLVSLAIKYLSALAWRFLARFLVKDFHFPTASTVRLLRRTARVSFWRYGMQTFCGEVVSHKVLLLFPSTQVLLTVRLCLWANCTFTHCAF